KIEKLWQPKAFLTKDHGVKTPEKGESTGIIYKQKKALQEAPMVSVRTCQSMNADLGADSLIINRCSDANVVIEILGRPVASCTSQKDANAATAGSSYRKWLLPSCHYWNPSSS
ncbi:hypothetical protein ACH5RR_037152, partial [Cinchona calisaya]